MFCTTCNQEVQARRLRTPHQAFNVCQVCRTPQPCADTLEIRRTRQMERRCECGQQYQDHYGKQLRCTRYGDAVFRARKMVAA